MAKEEAISIISGYEAYGCGYCLQGGDEVEEALKLAVDALEQEPIRHGKWIYGNDFHWYTASCNKCGYQRRTDIKADRWNQWKYCPNCGAKMDERKEE